MTRHLVATIAIIALALVSLGGVASAGDMERGQVLYDLCQQCHGPAGEGDPMTLAPNIAGLDQWYIEAQLNNFKAGLRGLHPEDVGGMRMYPMAQWLRKESDVAAVAAYVASLPKEKPTKSVDGDASKGATLYANCAACHGPDGRGIQGMNAPPLAGTSDWYLQSQLQKFKAGIRGGNPQNSNAVMMRGMSAMLTDEQAIRDVIAHIQTLDK